MRKNAQSIEELLDGSPVEFIGTSQCRGCGWAIKRSSLLVESGKWGMQDWTMGLHRDLLGSPS